ncbi:MAG: hypothetical protein IJ306_07440 [Oscillospiraceae bacterium]|nr:hypothetical protein [Oscillospiraceae bacterium]
MPENYARETNVKNSSGKDCRNSGNSNSTNRASSKSASNEASNRTPMSKQNAAQRKTEDCGR